MTPVQQMEAAAREGVDTACANAIREQLRRLGVIASDGLTTSQKESESFRIACGTTYYDSVFEVAREIEEVAMEVRALHKRWSELVGGSQ